MKAMWDIDNLQSSLPKVTNERLVDQYRYIYYSDQQATLITFYP